MKVSVSNHENLHFSSKVRLKADSSGLVDLTKSVPSCGAYQVPDLMALYWKMDYQKGSDKRLLKFHEVTFNHVFHPINIHFSSLQLFFNLQSCAKNYIKLVCMV